MPSHSHRFSFFPALLLIIAGCTIAAESTSFLTHGSELKKDGKLPFNGTWIGDEQRLIETSKRTGKVFVADVDIENALKKVDQSQGFERFKRYRREELAEMARYMKVRFKAGIAGKAVRPVELVEEPGPGTLILKLAIIEVIPTNAVIGVLGTVGGVFLPGAGAASFLSKGSIAMEGKVVDGATDEVLFEFKDRASDKTALFSIKDYQQYAHIRSVIDTWADEYGQLQAQDFEGKVEAALPFSLNPF